MILLRELQAHPRFASVGNYLITKKLLQGKLLLLCSPKEGRMENVATRKRDSKEAVEPYYTG